MGAGSSTTTNESYRQSSGGIDQNVVPLNNTRKESGERFKCPASLVRVLASSLSSRIHWHTLAKTYHLIGDKGPETAFSYFGCAFTTNIMY